jgi:AraC-like DNA-binding protein
MLLRFGGEQSQDLSSIVETGSGFLEQARRVLELHLDKPGLSFEAFAALTSQGSSNLKRKFRQHGTTFRTELNASRKARARALLAQKDISLMEIANRIGISDQPSFSRSFKQWTGVSPGEYRKRLHSGDRKQLGETRLPPM